MIRRYWKYLRFIIIPLVLMIVTGVFFAVLDRFSSGILAEWFERMYMFEYQDTANDGGTIIIRQIDWESLKLSAFTLWAFVIMILSWVLIVAADVLCLRERRKHSRTAAEYLRRYLVEENAVPADPVPEDTEIFAGINETRLKISEQKAQLLREAQRKNDLITYLAHDLKTPLTSVLGYLTLLNEEPEMSVQQRARFTGVALKKAQRLEELLDEIFEITRFDIANIELQKEQVNLSGMLEQILSEFEPLLSDKNLTIQSEIEKKLFLNCDVDKTERIIDNLIRNAVSYSFENSVINISLKKENTNAVFRFENRGKTIPQEKLDRIFDRFYRADQSRSSSSGGSGLGLAIARSLAQAHGGNITAQSYENTIIFTLTMPECGKEKLDPASA
ncbi:MAG: HAMP domain-containing sensor histidine kinase [Eubacteriales bacterium]|nr:HAMP domain-containing sensor histidine kinase [Eubacteriales bacterium]